MTAVKQMTPSRVRRCILLVCWRVGCCQAGFNARQSGGSGRSVVVDRVELALIDTDGLAPLGPDLHVMPMPEITSRLSTALADRYRIERHLGEGGMATVYLAEDLKHKRKVAVKVLRPELAAVLGAERFIQEITTTANLQHPHILPLFDSGEADGFLYYVMPFIDGETRWERATDHDTVDDCSRYRRDGAERVTGLRAGGGSRTRRISAPPDRAVHGVHVGSPG